jgi:hypothetical protein
LVRTNSARLRLSFGGIGGYLVNKFVKQTKINSWLAHKSGCDQVGLIEAELRVAELAKLVAELKGRVEPAASTPTFESGVTLAEKL